MYSATGPFNARAEAPPAELGRKAVPASVAPPPRRVAAACKQRPSHHTPAAAVVSAAASAASRHGAFGATRRAIAPTETTHAPAVLAVNAVGGSRSTSLYAYSSVASVLHK